MTNPVIQIEDLSFAYPHQPVLKNVNLQVQAGEMIGIIGPNGGGKTTLLKLIMGFLKPTHGTIKVLNQKENHPCIAYVPQAMRFDRDFPISVLDVVLSGLLFRLPWYGKFRHSDRALAYDALKRVDLSQYADAPFGSLSGGQAQRVLIARAIVSEPKILLLDEPTASVDQQAQTDIVKLLKELKQRMTILMVTHDLQTAVEMMDRLFCVQGHVIAMRPEEVCEHFAIGLYHPPIVNLYRR